MSYNVSRDMSLISVFENLRFNGKFLKNIMPYISGYFLAFIFILIGIWLAYGLDKYLMAGFTLFSYFPSWLRFVCLDLIASSLIAIPFGVVTGFFISMVNESYHYSYIEDLRTNLSVECIECSKTIKPQGMWINGQTDIICRNCGALMTIFVEEGRFKKLILKVPTIRRW
jgi:ribosomal protein S27E